LKNQIYKTINYKYQNKRIEFETNNINHPPSPRIYTNMIKFTKGAEWWMEFSIQNFRNKENQEYSVKLQQ